MRRLEILRARNEISTRGPDVQSRPLDYLVT